MPPSAPVNSAPRIAVIGGGITGLAAAHRVVELLPGADVHVFEAAPRLGGILETIDRDGFLIERSADNFLTKSTSALDLCRRLGIADELLPTDATRRRAFVVRAGRLAPIPEGYHLMAPRKLGPILASPILSLPGKLRLLAEPLIPRGAACQLKADTEPAAADESVASFARRRLGREVFERLVQPLVAGIYTADAEKLSMAAAMPEFLAQERTSGHLLSFGIGAGRGSDEPADATGARYSLFVAPKGGMSALIRALADRLPSQSIHLDTHVHGISMQSDGEWQLEVKSCVSSGGRPGGSSNAESASRHPPMVFHALILAVPAHAAARLLQTCDPELAAELDSIEYASSAVVSLGFERAQIGHPLDGFGLVVPQIEGRRIIAASFASQKFPGRAPAGCVLIRAFIGGALQAVLLERSDAELRQLAIDELRDLLQIRGEPLVGDLVRWYRAMPQYHVGHLARVGRIDALAARIPGLALAGNAYHGVGIAQCISSGESAAQQIIASFCG